MCDSYILTLLSLKSKSRDMAVCLEKNNGGKEKSDKGKDRDGQIKGKTYRETNELSWGKTEAEVDRRNLFFKKRKKSNVEEIQQMWNG